MKDEIIDAWINHLGLSNSKFPRDVGFPWRKKVNSRDEYIEEIQKKINTSNVYTSLYSDDDIVNSVISEVYIDIDSDIVEKSRKEMVKIVSFLSEEIDCIPRVYFTASKGFAIHIDFRPLYIENIHAVRSWILGVADELRITVDSTVLGEWRRISRLPYSLNFNSLKKYGVKPRMCVPVDPSWSMSKIFSESRKCKMDIQVEINPSDEFRRMIDEYQKEYVEPIDFDVNSNGNGTKELRNRKRAYDVLLYLLNNAHRIRDGRHRILNFLVIPACIKLGMTKEQTINFCEKFVEGTERSFPNLGRYISTCYKRNVEGDWLPWSPSTFLERFPELYDVFKRGDQS